MKDSLKDLLLLVIIIGAGAGMVWAVWTFGGH